MNKAVEFPSDLASAHQIISRQSDKISELEHQVAWFKRQLFGAKSERRLDIVPVSGKQICLGEQLDGESKSKDQSPGTTVKEHVRKKSNKQALPDDCGESGLRFDSNVPVEEVTIPCPELEGENADEYEFLSERVVERLAQRPGAYYVVRYRGKKVKHKGTGKITEPVIQAAVFEKTFSDVTLLAGILIDKFLYHLPLFRLHQRIVFNGIKISRGSLTNYCLSSIGLLEPIYNALVEMVVTGRVKAMDETPVKVGYKSKGKMHKGYFWPVYGEQNEVIFPYAETRAAEVVREVLKEHGGVLISDGYAAYDKYAASVDNVILAQCWAHARRKFFEAQDSEPKLAAEALERIGVFYENEEKIRKHHLEGIKKLVFRVENTRPKVEEFFEWLKGLQKDNIFLPKNPFYKALSYTLSRQVQLEVFLSDPEVPIDTNHLERALRVIPMGRKAWMFCMTELGAKSVGIIQSLLVTCRLHEVDPFTYLVDVFQRISTHPQEQVHLLTPRLWKEHFSQNPIPAPR